MPGTERAPQSRRAVVSAGDASKAEESETWELFFAFCGQCGAPAADAPTRDGGHGEHGQTQACHPPLGRVGFEGPAEGLHVDPVDEQPAQSQGDRRTCRGQQHTHQPFTFILYS